MAHPHLTYYLLELATDPNALAQYNAGDKNQRHALGKAAGLTPEQCDALESADSSRIMDQVLAELGGKTIPAGGVHYTIQVLLDLQPCKKNA
jgi:hypothetical protein